MPKITIHTATYNRAYILGKAYNSLRNQTIKDFEWIISDDGSTDNTEELVKKWMKADNGFEIHYYKLSHVGIPRALNNGVQHSNAEWFMMLDSDDYFVPETIEKIIPWLNDVDLLDKFAGVGFCCCFPDGSYMKPQKPIIDPKKGYVDATHLERAKYNFNMDSCEVHRTRLLRKYPFQYWETEKYAPEQLCFYAMAFDGWKMRWRNEKLCICDYLPDGQTKDNKLVKNNPMGFAMMYNQNLLRFHDFKSLFYNASQMIALSFYSRNMNYLAKSNNKIMTALALPFGIVLGYRRRAQFSKL